VFVIQLDRAWRFGLFRDWPKPRRGGIEKPIGSNSCSRRPVYLQLISLHSLTGTRFVIYSIGGLFDEPEPGSAFGPEERANQPPSRGQVRLQSRFFLNF
jgi:hypothetical protein